jgi:hypothetical protein
MLPVRVLLPTPMLLAFGGVLRSFAVLRVVPTATSAARLVARPPASSIERLVGFASPRALSTVATPIASAANKGDDAVAAPMRAAELRGLDVLGVVAFVKKELKIDPDDSEKLVKQKIDGAALLETSVDELCGRFELSGGAAHAIMRAVERSQSAVLTIYPPKKKKSDSNQFRKQLLTPATFVRMFDVLKAPLHIVNSSGSVLRVATTLAEAFEASQEAGIFFARRGATTTTSSHS